MILDVKVLAVIGSDRFVWPARLVGRWAGKILALAQLAGWRQHKGMQHET